MAKSSQDSASIVQDQIFVTADQQPDTALIDPIKALFG